MILLIFAKFNDNAEHSARGMYSWDVKWNFTELSLLELLSAEKISYAIS